MPADLSLKRKWTDGRPTRGRSYDRSTSPCSSRVDKCRSAATLETPRISAISASDRSGRCFSSTSSSRFADENPFGPASPDVSVIGGGSVSGFIHSLVHKINQPQVGPSARDRSGRTSHPDRYRTADDQNGREDEGDQKQVVARPADARGFSAPEQGIGEQERSSPQLEPRHLDLPDLFVHRESGDDQHDRARRRSDDRRGAVSDRGE